MAQRNDEQVALRLPAHLIEEMDEIVRQLLGVNPKAKISRSDVMRMLLIHGVKSYQRDAAKTKRERRGK